MQTARIIAAMLVATHAALAQTAPKPVAVIGGDRNGGVQLENPSDISVIGDRIIVLDASEPFLRVFDFSGKQLQTTVKKGNGPGEISAAYSFAVDTATSKVYTLDVMNLRANVYGLRDTLTYETTLGLAGPMEDACVIGNHVYTMGMFGSHLLHELEPRNGRLEFVRSFAVPRTNSPLDQNPSYQQQVAKGRLACDPGRQRLVAVSTYGGVAQIVDLRTLAQQTVMLDGLTPITFTNASDGRSAGVALSAPAGHDRVHRVNVTRDGVRFFADHLAKGSRGSEDFTSVSEWLVLPNGTLQKGNVARQREVGRSGNRIACFIGSPIPTIEIYQATRCP